MEWVKAINDAIEFMEKNLTGITPAEYIRNRRLSLAGAEIAKGDKIIDVAFKYCYETPESFTKAFSRFHGCSPMQARKGSPLQFMSRYTVRISIEGGCIMEFKIEKWDAVDLLVHAKNFHAETSDNEIPAFWGEYFSNETTKKIPGYLGVCAQGFAPDGQATPSDVFKYGIGCRAKETQGIFFQGQIFDAYAKFESFLSAAKKEIILIDNYVELSILQRLTKKKKGVTHPISNAFINLQIL